MPRGDPKKPINVRLAPELVEEARALTDNLTRAIEEGLCLWIARERRRCERQRTPE
ncbi:MAG: type II toxin-antitoxin system CcdA family antitoxin [Gemmatimonadaceae bacterium]